MYRNKYTKLTLINIYLILATFCWLLQKKIKSSHLSYFSICAQFFGRRKCYRLKNFKTFIWITRKYGKTLNINSKSFTAYQPLNKIWYNILKHFSFNFTKLVVPNTIDATLEPSASAKSNSCLWHINRYR